jgi:hypothetical protein
MTGCPAARFCDLLRRSGRGRRAARGLFKEWMRLEALTRFFGLTARSPKSRTTFDNL